MILKLDFHQNGCLDCSPCTILVQFRTLVIIMLYKRGSKDVARVHHLHQQCVNMETALKKKMALEKWKVTFSTYTVSHYEKGFTPHRSISYCHIPPCCTPCQYIPHCSTPCYISCCNMAAPNSVSSQAATFLATSLYACPQLLHPITTPNAATSCYSILCCCTSKPHTQCQ